MTIFFGTLIIVLLCCLAMGLGAMIDGRSLSGGCGSTMPGIRECGGCLKRCRRRVIEGQEGESEC
jgi:hypothetical protein